MKLFPTNVYVISGGSVTNNQWALTMEYTGPSSYPTGGFVVDMDPTFSSLNSLKLSVKTVGANLPVAHYEITLNAPAAGQATVKIMRHRFDQVTAVGNVTNQPTGVTVLAANGGTSSLEASHTQSIEHDHGTFGSAINNSGGAQVLLNALGPNLEQHTHQLDLPNLTGQSGAGLAHNHTDNSIYQHGHSIGFIATNIDSVELPNGTNLSGTIWNILAFGVKG